MCVSSRFLVHMLSSGTNTKGPQKHEFERRSSNFGWWLVYREARGSVHLNLIPCWACSSPDHSRRFKWNPFTAIDYHCVEQEVLGSSIIWHFLRYQILGFWICDLCGVCNLPWLLFCFRASGSPLCRSASCVIKICTIYSSGQKFYVTMHRTNIWHNILPF